MAATRWIAGLIAALGLSAPVSAQQMQIQFAEPVTFVAAPGAAQFDAYGRRFALELVGNERALAKLPATRKQQLAGIRLLRGKLTGNAASWVRLTTFAGGVEGVIWDGRDLYTLTTYGRIASFLTHKLSVPATQKMVYRLSDTLNALPAEFCATSLPGGPAARNGLEQFQKLTSELSSNTALAATLDRQVEIALVSDTRFQEAYGTDSLAQMLARFNISEGIFAEQLQLLLLATDVRVVATPDPFTSTAASTLLDQVKNYRRINPAVGARAVAHLITGKDLDGDTAGIAVLGRVCDLEGGISLSEGLLGVTTSGLIMAHELGHNFGAGHDGEGACAGTPQSFLMSRILSGSSTLSQCSLNAIRPVLQTASCVSAAVYAQAELAPSVTPMTVENDTPATIEFDVSSTGSLAANDVRLHVDVPSALAITSVNPSAACTVSANALDCALGTLAPGQDRTVEVAVLPSREGMHTINATVSASNNQSSRNVSAQQVVGVIPNSAGSISVTATPSQVIMGDFVDFPVTVASLRSHALIDTRVNLVAGGMTFVSVSGDASCVLATNQAICQLGQVPGQTTRQFTLRAQATAVGEFAPDAFLTASNDATSDDNRAWTTVRVSARRDVALEAPPASAYTVAIADTYELTANVHSVGVEAIDGVVFRMSARLPTGASPPDSVTIGGQTCVPSQPYTYECAIGTMAAGEIRQVVIRGRATMVGSHEFDYRTYSPQQDNSSNDDATRGVSVRHPVDVRAASSTGSFSTEAHEFSVFAVVESLGINAATSEVTVDVPAEVRITRFFANSGSCEIQNPQRLRCTISFDQAGDRRFLTWFGISDVPGTYTLRTTTTTVGDGDQANDRVESPLTINALVDMRVDSLTVPASMFVGREYTIPATVVVGTRPVTAAKVSMEAAFGLAMDALTSSQGNCARVSMTRFECELGDLPGGTSIGLIGTISGSLASSSTMVVVRSEAQGDNDPSNDSRSALARVMEAGDLQLSVASTTVTAASGSSLSYPRISIRRTGPAVDGRLTLTLPSFVSVNFLSGTVICSGTATIECQLPSSWPEADALLIDLTLAADSAGTFTSNLRVTSANDTNAANDDATVAITVTAPPPPPPPPPSGGNSSGGTGGGGGGSLEWLSLGLLAALARGRYRRAGLKK